MFTRLANSVRGGLGDIGTMKPKVFPDRVDEIVALLEHYKNNGGNSGDSSIPTKVETGTFTASETGVGRVYINHTLGEVPDFVMIRLSHREGNLNTDKNPIMAAWSFKDNIYPSNVKGGLNCTNGNNPTYTGHDIAVSDSYMAQVFSYIKCLNKVTFHVGSDLSFDNNANQHFVPNATYSWLAVSGLKNVAVESLVVTENGTYSPAEGVYGFSPVVVNVPVSDPVLQPLTITENGTYTAPAGVDGYNPVTVNVDPTKITILKEQEISGFALDEEFGYIKNEVQTYTVNIGETYFVIWDGVTYETTALAADSFVEGAVFLGNGTMLGLPGNDEPFAIGYANDMIMYLAFTDPSESHSAGIWQNVTQEIKLQDKTITENGEYTADSGFDGLGKVLVEVAGSGDGAAGVERITIIPEQTVTPTYDSSYGCYEIVLTPSEKITEDSVLAIRFNGEWYVCSSHKYACMAGSWDTTMTVFGNHKIMTKFVNSSLTWKETAEQAQPFLMTTNSWVFTSNADSYTIRVDKLIVTE